MTFNVLLISSFEEKRKKEDKILSDCGVQTSNVTKKIWSLGSVHLSLISRFPFKLTEF